MNSNSVQKQVLALKRLVVARVTFNNVRLLCEHIQGLGSNTFTPLHVPLFAGVSITYMKPFMRNDGLGDLSSRFSRFPGASGHQKTHVDLKNCRDWYYAHRDMIKAPTLLADPQRRSGFEDVTLHVAESGISFSVNEQSWSFSSVSRVRSLCSYQKSRIDKEVLALLEVLKKGRELPQRLYHWSRLSVSYCGSMCVGYR
jgi:hypothetical protein